VDVDHIWHVAFKSPVDGNEDVLAEGPREQLASGQPLYGRPSWPMQQVTGVGAKLVVHNTADSFHDNQIFIKC